MVMTLIRPRDYAPEDYGAIGDGTTDDTIAIQSAINACPEGGTVIFGPTAYKITAALTITKSMTLVGSGCYPLTRSVNTTFADFDSPGQSPFLNGTVLLQSTAATDGIQITGTGKSVHLKSFGIRFADAIRHVNTGNGVTAIPSSTYNSGHDHGLFYSHWNDITVFGHDGNHYAFSITNPMQCTFSNLRGFGGGGLNMACDSYAGNYGNCVFIHPYFNLYCNGSSYGYNFNGRANGATGYLNLIVLVRPQCNIDNSTAKFPETTTPNLATQYAFFAQNKVGNMAVIQGDFEPLVSNVLTLFADGARFTTPDGLYGNLTNTNTDFITQTPIKGGRNTYSDGNQIGLEASATAAAGANAGTSPPAPVLTNAGDYSGSITFGTGTAPTAGVLATVTFSQYRGTAYRVFVTPQNAATAALGLYAVKAGGSFTICAANAPAASQANTVYAVDYQTVFAG